MERLDSFLVDSFVNAIVASQKEIKMDFGFSKMIQIQAIVFDHILIDCWTGFLQNL